MYETKEFEFENKSYEIRIVSDGWKTRIRVFLDGKPANGYEYSVELPVMINAKNGKLPFDPKEELIVNAENDVREKRYERYLEAVKNK
jgi:hypothetical protein